MNLTERFMDQNLSQLTCDRKSFEFENQQLSFHVMLC